jgi:hypothetical protein
MSVAAAKILQLKWTNLLAWPACLVSLPACLVLCLLQALTLVEVDFYQTNMPSAF